VRAWLHRAFRGHSPEWSFLGRQRICLICDTGSPTGSYVVALG
jgi:hypothetical protein